MFERLEQIAARYEDLGRQLGSDEIVNDHLAYQKIAKQHRDLQPVVNKFREYQKIQSGIVESTAMLTEEDAEIRAMAEEELAGLEERLPRLEEEIKLMLLPKDPNDEKNVIIEIRAGTGGDEASLFAAEMFRMYSRFAEQHRWKVEVLSTSDSGVGGMKEVIFLVEGRPRLLADALRERRPSCTARACDRNGRDACIHPPLPSPCCRKPKKWM